MSISSTCERRTSALQAKLIKHSHIGAIGAGMRDQLSDILIAIECPLPYTKGTASVSESKELETSRLRSIALVL